MIFVGLFISGGILCLVGVDILFLNKMLELGFLEKFGWGEKKLWGSFWVVVFVVKEGGFLKFLLLIECEDFWEFKFGILWIICFWRECCLVIFFFFVGIFLVVSFIIVCGCFLVLWVNVFCRMEILLLFKDVFF